MSLKYRPRLKIYKNSTGTNTFDPETFKAYSYSHWCYLIKFKGKVIFNKYRYSNSTSKHQSDLRSLLRELKINVDVYVNQPSSLDRDFKNTVLIHLYTQLFQLEIEMNRRGSRKEKNEYRQRQTKDLLGEIKTLKKIGAEFSRAKQSELKKQLLDAESSRLKNQRLDREILAIQYDHEDLKPKLADLGPIDLKFQQLNNLESIKFERKVKNENQSSEK